MATRKVIRKRRGSMVAPLQQPKGRRRGQGGSAPKRRKIGRKILLLVLVVVAVRWAWVKLDLGTHLALPYGSAVPVDSLREVAADPQQLHVKPESESDSDAVGKQAEAAVSDSTKSDTEKAGWLSGVRSWSRAQIDKIFVVREVRLQGTLSIPRDSLMARLGDLEGKPMFELDLFGLATAVRSHPRVRKAELLRRLPGTLEVRITERRELAVFSSAKGLQGVDETGVVLSPPAPGWPVDVPIVTGADWTYSVGDTLQEENLLQALAWIRTAEREPRVQYWLSEVHVNRDGVEWVSGVNGWRVRPGTHAIGAQVSALNAYLGEQNPEDHTARTLDLRFPGFLIVKRNS